MPPDAQALQESQPDPQALQGAPQLGPQLEPQPPYPWLCPQGAAHEETGQQAP
ncbi:MAG TPA: hypothetical protein VFG20_02695 [Planctomycetaceae bacterium]|nr:hypothetical protein [Planctomycetaceae bacterium]